MCQGGRSSIISTSLAASGLGAPAFYRARARRKDRWRDENLEAVGMKVLRLPNEVILNRPLKALELLQSTLKGLAER